MDEMQYQPELVYPDVSVPRLKSLGMISNFSQRRWIGCTRSADGALYLPGNLVSRDGGQTWETHANAQAEQLPMLAKPEGALYAGAGLTLVLDGCIREDSGGSYFVRTWRSSTGFTDLIAGSAPISGLSLKHGPDGALLSACFTREIVPLPDGTLLAPAYASFDQDTLPPRRPAQPPGDSL